MTGRARERETTDTEDRDDTERIKHWTTEDWRVSEDARYRTKLSDPGQTHAPEETQKPRMTRETPLGHEITGELL